MSTTLSAPVLLKKPLSARDRHFADRFSFGYNKALEAAVADAGSGRAWFERQLRYESIKDKAADATKSWYPNMWYSPAQLFKRNYHDIYPAWELMNDLGRWTMMRRILSNRQLHEMMVDFWSNSLQVAIGDDAAWPFRISYDAMIRKHALGRFENMLVDAITHPAMGLWLDNATSTRYAPNENLGREVLELYSVGVNAGYTQKDVESSAKLLTGYRVDIYAETKPGVYDGVNVLYYKDWHWKGKLRIFGFKTPNSDRDGRKETEKYLRYLANHPATADRMCRRLAVRFVHDEPSKDLIRTMTKAWTRSGTDIKATLQAMVGHPEFASSAGEKVRKPLEDLLATVRALEIKPLKPRNPDNYGDDFATSIFWRAYSLGQTPYDWPQPNGHPEDNLPWSSAGRALNSFDMHRSLAAWYHPEHPKDDNRVKVPPIESWLPKLPNKFGTVVNHISGELLGVPANAKAKRAVSERTGIQLDKKVTADDMGESVVAQILTALLGSPTHMTR